MQEKINCEGLGTGGWKDLSSGICGFQIHVMSAT